MRPVKNSDELLLVHIDMATRKAEHDPLLPRKRKGMRSVTLLWVAVFLLLTLGAVLESVIQ